MHAPLLVALLAAASSTALAQVATGHYVGNGGSSRPVSGVGFTPDVVLVKGDTDSGGALKTRSMPAGMVKIITAGTSALLAGSILSLDGDGFTVDQEWRVNKASSDYWYVAFQSRAGNVVEGSYVGDGGDDRRVGGLGFQPDLVLVTSEQAQPTSWRSAAMPDGLSAPLEHLGLQANRIQRFLPDGFEVGSHASVNAAGATHYYVAFRGVASGRYLGDGQDDRAVADAGFAPALVLLKGDSATLNVLRPAAMAGDVSLPLHPAFKLTNAIQALLPDGFQVGTAPEVNGSGVNLYWASWPLQFPDAGAAGAVDGGADAGAIVTQVSPEHQRVAPGEAFELRGSATRGGAAVAVSEWRWQLVEGPTGARLTGEPTQRLSLSEPGRYRFVLNAEAASGEQSPPAAGVVEVSGDAYSPPTDLSGCTAAGGVPVLLALALLIRASRRGRSRPRTSSGTWSA